MAALVNWIGCTPSDGWCEESWSARGDRDEALTLFEGWHHQVRALIAGTDQVFEWALFDRPSLQAWTRGRVALLGDAAHPMLPFMGQGAAQSIEDGLVLACCLAADRDDPQRAIGAYASRRCERAAALQAASREQGRDLQLSGSAEVAARNAQMRESPEAPAARLRLGQGVRRGARHRRRLVKALRVPTPLRSLLAAPEQIALMKDGTQ